jgi:hypothetical protein
LCTFLAIAACSTDDGAAREEGATTSVRAEFDALPRLPQSREVGARSSKAGTVTQSFSVEGVTPDGVLDFYEDELTTWAPSGREDVGAAVREDFVHPDGSRLEVSAIVFDPGDGLAGTTQYSLVLHE